MNKNLVIATLALATLSLTACAGVKTRSPAEWRTELGAGFAARSSDLKACYDTSGVKTKVELALKLDANQHADKAGGWSAVSVQSVKPADASDMLVECVKKVTSTMVVSPEDKKNATGTWVLTFDPAVGSAMGASIDVVSVPKA